MTHFRTLRNPLFFLPFPNPFPFLSAPPATNLAYFSFGAEAAIAWMTFSRSIPSRFYPLLPRFFSTFPYFFVRSVFPPDSATPSALNYPSLTTLCPSLLPPRVLFGSSPPLLSLMPREVFSNPFSPLLELFLRSSNPSSSLCAAVFSWFLRPPHHDSLFG